MDILEELAKGERYLIAKYPDQSVRIFRTTLNEEILKIYNFKSRDVLYNLDTGEEIPMSILEVCQLEVSEKFPEVSKLDAYINRFV